MRVNTRIWMLRRDGRPPPGERRLGGEHDAHRREECNGDGGGPAGAMESFRSHKSRVFGCVARRDGF